MKQVKKIRLTCVSWWNLRDGLWLRTAPDLFRRSHSIQNALYDLFRPGAVRHVDRLRLEKLRVRQDDSQLVVQLVKQHAELWVHGRGIHLDVIVPTKRQVHAEWPVVAECATLFEPAGRVASRQSESAKMRIEPPAVRTYSTFPAEIQL